MTLSGSSAEEIYSVFSRVFAGRRSPFAIHSRSYSGRELHCRACRGCRPASRGSDGCSHCRGGAYREMMPADIMAHLEGRTAVGVYPTDESGLCRFSVIALGGEAPARALRSLDAACKRLGAGCLCEVCGGGLGARLWLFFGRGLSPEAAVFAALRVIYEAFLTDKSAAEAVTGILPTAGAGFGRPAVLPLFDIEGGGSFLLDGDFEPSADPLRLLGGFDPPAADFSFPKCTEALSLKAERCGALYINAAKLSAGAFASLCLAACFPSVAAAEFSAEPAVERCFALAGGRVAVPRGVDLAALFPEAEITVTESGALGRSLRLRGSGSLSPWQSEALESLLNRGGGIITAPTGSGKTAVLFALLARLGRSALILTPDRAAARRWRSRLGAAFGLGENGVGLVEQKDDWPLGAVDVAVLGPDAAFCLAERLPEYGVVIVADCDRMTNAAAFRECMETACARYVFGCSARPVGQARLAPYIRLYVGGAAYELK